MLMLLCRPLFTNSTHTVGFKVICQCCVHSFKYGAGVWTGLARIAKKKKSRNGLTRNVRRFLHVGVGQ